MTKIYSIFADNEDWTDLLSEFVGELPDRIAAIESAVRSSDLPGLIILVHQLRGACGSYGYESLTPLATELELALQREPSIAAWRESIDQFVHALACMTDQSVSQSVYQSHPGPDD